MSFALLVAISGTVLGGVAGWIIASFTKQFGLRWDFYITQEAREHLGMPSEDLSPPAVLLLRPQVEPRFALVAAVCVAASILIFSAVGFAPAAVPLLLFTFGLTAAALVDHERMMLPDLIVQPLLWAGLISVALTDPSALQWHVLGAAVGYGLFRVVPKLGEGDAKLCAAVGAWLGLYALPAFVLLAGALGTAVGLVYYVKRGRSEPCPFGPPLAVAALALMACKVAGVSMHF